MFALVNNFRSGGYHSIFLATTLPFIQHLLYKIQNIFTTKDSWKQCYNILGSDCSRRRYRQSNNIFMQCFVWRLSFSKFHLKNKKCRRNQQICTRFLWNLDGRKGGWTEVGRKVGWKGRDKVGRKGREYQKKEKYKFINLERCIHDLVTWRSSSYF